MQNTPPAFLKAIRIADELLPQWAQLLDVAARLCSVPEETRRWFARFTASGGIDDSTTIFDHCQLLRSRIVEKRTTLHAELQHHPEDGKAGHIIGAWLYALDTMLQEADSSETCEWSVEGADDEPYDDAGGGDITFRRL